MSLFNLLICWHKLASFPDDTQMNLQWKQSCFHELEVSLGDALTGSMWSFGVVGDVDGTSLLDILLNDSVLTDSVLPWESESMDWLCRSALFFVRMERYFLILSCRCSRTLRWRRTNTMKMMTPRSELHRLATSNRTLLDECPVTVNIQFTTSKIQGIPVMKNNFNAILILENMNIIELMI